MRMSLISISVRLGFGEVVHLIEFTKNLDNNKVIKTG